MHFKHKNSKENNILPSHCSLPGYFCAIFIVIFNWDRQLPLSQPFIYMVLYDVKKDLINLLWDLWIVTFTPILSNDVALSNWLL